MIETSGGVAVPPHEPAISVKDIKIRVFNQRGVGRPVDGVSFDLYPGETLGLVGESGCGKSVTSLSLVGLLPKQSARVVEGSIRLDGQELTGHTDEQWRKVRGSQVAMIPQDPLSSLNPVLTIGSQLCDPIKLHKGLKGRALKDQAIELLNLMKVPAAEGRLNSYPHQFSGGMRQRVVGAIGLSGDPKVLIADEPTTALDVTVQAAYIKLLKDVQRRTGQAVLFITHDFSIVGDICHRVAVMYAGRIVEMADTAMVFDTPSHPYTKALLRSVPQLKHGSSRLFSIPGSPPSIYDQPKGCRFHPRCWLYEALGKPDRCRSDVPGLAPIGEKHISACHFSDHPKSAASSP